MNLGKVFIGYTKDGKERCLFKKNKSYVTDTGVVNATVYEDLESKEEFNIDFVDEASLIPYTYGLHIQKTRMTRRKVNKVYQADRNKLIDVRGVYFGSLVEKCPLKKVEQNHDVEDILKENVLFAKTYDEKGRVEDLRYSKLYYSADKVLSGVAAKEIRPINYQQFDRQMQTKRKVLEMNYRKEL